MGPYEILALIGAGGMGEVYRAKDTNLKRDVALKVLPEAFAADPERMARFRREAEVMASLNHPNIAHIYGVEDRALVMELVEGETLPCPVPVETALPYAGQIADALEYAHERGVVHRDLKPANIKVTPEGVVKLLDFGLAKAIEDPRGADPDSSDSPTLTLGATRVGVILGTAAYMSPEQAAGKTVDRRSDIWSFGAVLYEMLAGKKAFDGESVSDTLASVLKLDPDWNGLPGSTPPAIRTLVRRCLTKDRKQRLQAIGEARIVLQAPLETAAPAQPEARPTRLSWAIAVGLAVIAAVLSWVAWRATRPVERPLVQLRYTIAAPGVTTVINSFAISPDGRILAIAALANSKRQLWMRRLDEFEAHALPFTDEAAYPFWSPDSRYIGFFAQGKLKKVAVAGGPAQPLCDVSDGRGGSWNRDGVIVFTPLPGQAIQQVSASGGIPAPVAGTKDRSGHPVFLPDGRHFLYVVFGGSNERNEVYLGSIDGQESRRVLSDAIGAAFAPGRLLFVRENVLMAQAFDAVRGETTGDALPISDNVLPTSTGDYAPVTVSENGVLLYQRSSGIANGSQLAWYDRAGKLLETIAVAPGVFEPTLSLDEKRVAFSRSSASGSDLWLRDLTTGAEQRFVNDPSFNAFPHWSPKGDRIVFASTRGGGTVGLYQKETSGTGREQPMLPSGPGRRPTQWSRDGRFIVFSQEDPKNKSDIWVLPLQGGDQLKPFPFLHSEFNERFGQLSPDSHWMAYTSDESGQPEVYVRPFPGGAFERRISIAGGQAPRWRGDGNEIFFLGMDGKMMAAAVKAAIGVKLSFESEVPQPLFDPHLSSGRNLELFRYDVTAEGKRFLLVATDRFSETTQLVNVVVNWDAGLKN